MNILVLTSEYPYIKDNNSDRTKVVGYFAKEWVKQGHTVIVIVNSSAFPSVYYKFGDWGKNIVSKTYDISRVPDHLWTHRFNYDENGVHVENLPMTKYIPHGKFSERVIKRQISEVDKILSDRCFIPDIITGHWVNPQIILVSRLAKKYRSMSAFIFHADYSEKICRKFKVQNYLKLIDRIGFRSKSAIEVANKYIDFSNPFVAASGVPDDFIEKYKTPPIRTYDNKMKILTAARLVEYKKIDSIINAVAKLSNVNSFELTIVGDGPLKGELEKQANSCGVSESVSFLGQIKRDELQERMRRADVFVLISKRETFGLVYIEAMLHGCIVIASRFGGVDGIIENGINGFLCDEGDDKELALLFDTISNMSVEEKNKMSSLAHSTAMLYSESDVAKRYIDNIVEPRS